MDVTFASRPGLKTLNEDFVAATNQAVVVLDGVSVPNGMDTGCIHSTSWYVRQLGGRLLRRVTDDLVTSLPDALADTITEVATLHSDTCDLTHPGTPAATVAVLRTAGHTGYLVLSDAVIALDTRYEGIKVINDDRVETTAVSHAQSVLATPVSAAERQGLRREMIRERQNARNTADGYWIASSSPEAAQHAITGSMRPGHVRQAAVLTDGAARTVQFGIDTWTGVFTTLDQHGPAELLKQVRRAERADADCAAHPRSKPYDDATVAYCRIDNIDTEW